MATAEVTKKLLLKYFREAPKDTIKSHLEVMYAALSPAQKNALTGLAKDYLLPIANYELEQANESFDDINDQANAAILAASIAVAEAETLVAEVESL